MCIIFVPVTCVGAQRARATYERMWRHHVGAGPKAFSFDVGVIEGDGVPLKRV